MGTMTPSRTMELTQRQREVLQVIRNHIESTGAPPTRAEIAKTLGFRSVNAAEDHLKALARKGAITLSPGTSRGIQLTSSYGIGTPILSQLHPTEPLLKPEFIEGRLKLENSLFKPQPDFLLRVHGISLSRAGIKDGDLLAVYQSTEAKTGQIVVAQLDNEWVIRRYYPQGDSIELQADNPDFEPITVQPHQNFQIVGVAVGVIRTGQI